MRANKEPYFLQKLAVKPFFGNVSEGHLIEHLRQMRASEKEELAEFIEINYLGPLWLETTGKDTIDEVWSREWRFQLQKQYKQIAILYIEQLKAIRAITTLLDSYSIEHAIFKGAHTREVVYRNPSARFAVDVDILILEEKKEETINILEREGYIFHSKSKNLSHEASLVKDHINIDLHWHIMRPGRIPKSLTAGMLEKRVRQDGYWSLNNEDTLFIMLTHSIFTKYLSIPHSGLIRILDLTFWLKKQPVDLHNVYCLLKNTGLMTAAWMTLEYLRLLTNFSPPQEFYKKLEPPSLKKWYLRQWIHNDAPSKFIRVPIIPKVLFTLMAHDSILSTLKFGYILASARIKDRTPFR